MTMSPSYLHIDILITLFLLTPKHFEGEENNTPAIMAQPTVQHSKLNTTFQGIRHSISSTENEIWQFRGIKYADIPGRFRQSTLHETFPPVYNATEYG